MRQGTYEIDGKAYRFSPAVFDGLLGKGSVGAARMRELAASINVSTSSLKDWRRGAHAPSDIEKVDDVAAWAKVPRDALLIETEGGSTMGKEKDGKLTESQLHTLCSLWNAAHDFLDLASETDYFVWPQVEIAKIPRSLRPELTRGAAESLEETGTVASDDLLESSRESYLRALRRASPIVGSSSLFEELAKFADVIEKMGYDEDGDWVPDPDMLFEPQPGGFASPIEAAEVAGLKLLDHVREELLAERAKA